jgi:hypothetical protein
MAPSSPSADQDAELEIGRDGLVESGGRPIPVDPDVVEPLARLGAGRRRHIDLIEPEAALRPNVGRASVTLLEHHAVERGPPADNEAVPALRAEPFLGAGWPRAFQDHLVLVVAGHWPFFVRRRDELSIPERDIP